MTTSTHHAHDHPPHLAHHWETPQQQFDAGKLGMWLFLATEVLFFGGLFVGYSVWRGNDPELFQYGSRFLDTNMGALNTAILILSSMTMALAVTFAQQSKQKALVICLVLTVLGGAGFMVIKYFEYTHKFHDGLFAGPAFYNGPPDPAKAHLWDPNLPVVTQEQLIAARMAAATTPPPPADATDAQPLTAQRSAIAPPQAGPSGLNLHADRASHDSHGKHDLLHPLQDPHRPVNAHVFFTIYYLMTGLHGIHVLVGMGVIGWLAVRAMKGHFNSEYFTPVDLVGLYWHVVDLVWIFLFPLFYLIH